MSNADLSFCEPLALNSAGGAAPEWVHLIPGSGAIRGADGRSWTMNDAPAIIDTFERRGIKLPIDVEHATQIKGTQGEEAPAVGFITELEARNTGLWGKVDWNERGQELITSRSYAYLSPVFKFAQPSGAITRMVSAALTNNPNLDLVALNREGAQKETPVMDKDVLEALGLNSDATAADAVTAINKLKDAEQTALNQAQTPSLDKFVPRADYDSLVTRVRGFEDEAEERQAEAINTAVDGAIEAGKITPAERDFYIASCQAEGGLDRFNTFVEGKREVAADSGLDGRDPDAPGKSKLTGEEQAVCHALGLSEDDFASAKQKG